MAEGSKNMLELLVEAPWWVSALLSAAVYMLLTLVLPGVFSEESLLGVLAGALSSTAWLIALILLIPAPVSFYNNWMKDRLLSGQADPSSLGRLSQRAFSQLVQELYTKNGYQVESHVDPQDQAEVDMIAKKQGSTVLVQYRYYKSGAVNEQAMQAMLERLDKGDAQEGHVISCPGFEEQVQELGRDSRLRLLDKQGLTRMLAGKE